MAFTFASAARTDSSGDTWLVSSRGTEVVRTGSLCDFAAGLIGEDPWGVAFAETHVATSLVQSDLDEHELILTASRDERAAIAKMRPSLRSRTFTLKEAIALGQEGVTADEVARASSASGEHPPLGVYASVIHARRGRIAVPAPLRMRPPWAQAVDPYDVPDSHTDRLRRHAETLENVQMVALTFYAQVARFLETRGAESATEPTGPHDDQSDVSRDPIDSDPQVRP